MRITLAALAALAVSLGHLSGADRAKPAPIPPVAFNPVFRAGAVAVDISPPKLPARIAGGFLENTGTTIVDRLHVRCLVLDDGRTKIAFAIVDTCMMTRQLIDEAKQLAAAQCGIPVDRMMVSATHTHSAPAAMGCLGTRQDKDYAAWLPGKIAEGIVAATKQLQPAKIGWASIDDWEHTHNRRWIRKPEKKVVDPFGQATGLANMHPGYLSPDIVGPSGPVDPGLSMISVQTRDGRPLAVLANYSQHYFGSGPVSADYYGLFCKHMARLLNQPGDGNGAFVCAISQGTSGDLMWMDYGSPRKTRTAENYAEAVAKYAEQALRQVRYHDSAPLAMVEKKLTLNYRVPDANRLAWARPIAAQIKDELPKDRTQVYANEALILHERQKTEIKLQAIRIGELAITTLPDEVYALTGLKLKAQSPFAVHFNIELANGAEGYIPTPEQHVLGGYTTWPARTAGLEVQAEPKIVETLLTALEEAGGRKRRIMQAEHGTYARSVLAAKPAACWRLDEAAGQLAMNAVAGGSPAKISDGFAWYLPGAGSGSGCGAGEKLAPSAFSGPNQINRAVHLAGGDIQADVPGLGARYSIALWFWLGEASGAGERSGTLAVGPGGETLGSRQSREHRVQLVLNGAASPQSLRADEWHFAVLVRDGNQVRVHWDGAEKPELAAEIPSGPENRRLVFGQGLQGKLDEISVFNRALTPAEIAAFWKSSGIAEQHARAAVERERAEKEVAKSSIPLKFPSEYSATVAALKPAIYAPLDVQPKGLANEGGVQMAPATYAAFQSGRLSGSADKLGAAFSVSLWFHNETPNEASAVTAYLFSRGPNGDRQAPGDHFGIGGSYRRDTAGRLLVFNGNAANQSLAGRSVIPPGTWNHAVFVRDGRHVRVYLNGGAAPEIDTEIQVAASGVKEFFLGARSDHFAPLHGHLAQFALFDRALTAEEAKRLHTASGQPAGVASIADFPKPGPVCDPLSPADSLKKIHVPAGFRVELVAAEPLLLDPVAFDWDVAGRLWVVEMSDYPLGMDGKGKPGGRIRVLEDTDGDGRYDKSTLFADGLNFPNGIITWRDGVIVTAAPEILFLKDTNGDGRADVIEPLFKGFFEGNQQLRVNGLRWGLDNWLYCAAGAHHGGYAAATKLKSLRTGAEFQVGSRDFRFRPDTGELDAQSGPTQFGRNRDDWGRWFGTQNSWPLWHYVLTDQYLRRNPHVGAPIPLLQVVGPRNPKVYPASVQEKRFHSFDEAGHFTSACAGMIYQDDLLFARDARSHAFTCEPFHNLVQHNVLTDDGVSFAAQRAAGEEKRDFFASEDRWCRPIMTRTGPDGALWVADMYRYIIEHPQFLPQSGKDELQPHFRLGDDRGRIYRVVPVNAAPRKPLRLDRLDAAGLVAALDSSNGWQRDKAQQLLLWRNDRAAVPHLEKLARESTNPRARLHALCALDGLGALKAELVAHALADAHPGVRENALRLAEPFGTPSVIAAAARLVDDADAKTRLQLAFSLGQWSDPRAGAALGRLAVASHQDHFLTAAVMSSALPHARAVVEAVAKAGGPALQALMGPLLNLSFGLNDRVAIARLLQPVLTASGRFTPEQVGAFSLMLDALAQRKSSLAELRGKNSDELSQLLANADALLAQARASATQASLPAADRIAAASLLSREPARRAEASDLLAAWLTPQFSADIQTPAIRALAATGAADVPERFAKAWSALGPSARQVMLDEWISREPWALNLVQRIEKGELSTAAIDPARRTRLVRNDSGRVRKLANKVFDAAASPSRAKVVEDYRPALSLAGNVMKGHETYLRVCAVCHKRGVEGKDIGPDLFSVLNHPPEKLLLNILDPNVDIQPGFHAYTCVLNTGEELYGLVAAETGNSITMKLPDGTTRTVPRGQIGSLRGGNLSLMPEGLEGGLTKQDMADLIAFLRTPSGGK
ncbi:MAG: PVC-type heme-binding CxxCH protein [Limisphaerales bacterium]